MSRVIIDVREPQEYSEGHVDGAINLPPNALMNGAKELADVPKNAEIIVYCRSGSRSNVAINILRTLGYKNLTNGINQQLVEAKFLKNK